MPLRRTSAERGAQRGRVECDEHVGLVGGGPDVLGREVDLVAGDARQGADRGADLGGEIREGREIVAGQCRRLGELGAGELHTVARIACETDRDPVEAFLRFVARRNRSLRIRQFDLPGAPRSVSADSVAESPEPGIQARLRPSATRFGLRAPQECARLRRCGTDRAGTLRADARFWGSLASARASSCASSEPIRSPCLLRGTGRSCSSRIVSSRCACR